METTPTKKSSKAVQLLIVVVGLQTHGYGAASVQIISQNMTFAATAALYQPSPFGGDELVVSRTANDESSVVGSRSAEIEATVEAGGVNQFMTGTMSVVVSNSPIQSLFRINGSASAEFTQDPHATLRNGKAIAQLGLFTHFWVSLDRPHNLNLVVDPSGPLTLNGTISFSVDSLNNAGNSSSTTFLTSPSSRTLLLQLGRGEHFLSLQLSVGGYGAFSMDEGVVTPVAGETEVVVTAELQAIGDLPYQSGRIYISQPANDAKLVLQLTELIPGRYYYLEKSNQLSNLPWEIVRSFYTISASATLVEPTNVSANSEFYRLRLIE